MGRQLLLELLQDRAFFFLLNDLSSLSCKQVYKSQIDSIHYQICTLLGRSTILRHRNGLCPCFVVTGDPPICILMLNGIGSKDRSGERKRLCPAKAQAGAASP